MILFFRIRVVLQVRNGFYLVTGDYISDNWIHVVLNYMGPGNGQGIQEYKPDMTSYCLEINIHQYKAGWLSEGNSPTLMINTQVLLQMNYCSLIRF